MTNSQFVDQVRTHIDAALLRHTIYEISSYGWLNENDANPAEIGHAMWQLDPPQGDPPFFHSQDLPPVSETWRRALYVASGDFDGLMKSSRRIIGHMIVYGDLLKEEIFSDRDLFEATYISAMASLSAASERIREYFIAAVFRKAAIEYQRMPTLKPRKRRTRALYKDPFERAARLVSRYSHSTARRYSRAFRSRNLSELITALPPIAEKIYVYRVQRNEILHSVATSQGRYERERLKGQKAHLPPSNFDFEEFKATGDRVEAEYRQRVDAEMATPIAWYKSLVALSNEVFAIENACRRHHDDQPR